MADGPKALLIRLYAWCVTHTWTTGQQVPPLTFHWVVWQTGITATRNALSGTMFSVHCHFLMGLPFSNRIAIYGDKLQPGGCDIYFCTAS